MSKSTEYIGKMKKTTKSNKIAITERNI